MVIVAMESRAHKCLLVVHLLLPILGTAMICARLINERSHVRFCGHFRRAANCVIAAIRGLFEKVLCLVLRTVREDTVMAGPRRQ